MRNLLKRLLDWLACLIAAVGVMTGCADGSPTDVLAIRATGMVAGLAFIDRDANQSLDPAVDAPLVGLRVALVLPSTADTIARSTTASDGGYLMRDVPVGRYNLVIDSVSAGDSLRVTNRLRDTLTVEANDTIVGTIIATYPTRTVAEARRLPPGRTVFVSGVVISGWNAFGDSTLHVMSGTTAIRAARVNRTTAAEGDSVLLLARTGIRDGQAALVDVAVNVLGSTAVPVPFRTTTALAASAESGNRDAAAVRIEGATILTRAVTPGGDLLLAVNDGSGRLEVLLDVSAPLQFTPYVPGAILDATGVLVPVAGSNTWRLKPRADHDLALRFPRATITDARAMSAGKRITIDGVALNGWANFSDGSIHFADRTGALRAFYAGTLGVYAADSVRFTGTIAYRGGEPALVDVEVALLQSPATLPAPQTISTVNASTADGGKLDAALVRVSGATVADTSTVTAGLQITVNDSSGVLTVLLDPAAGFTRGLYIPGRVLDLVGVLIPHDFNGKWQLRPRGKSDVAIR